MTNRYSGTCTKCFKTVAAGAGTCAKVDGRWVVSHTDCATAAPAPMRAGWSTASRRHSAKYGTVTPTSDYAFAGDEAYYDEY